MSTTYVGRRLVTGAVWVLVLEDGQPPRRLSRRLDLWNHSPTGFEWGFGGSGPAQLALAILADATGDDAYAVRRHQAFKWQVIAALPRQGWRLEAEWVRQWAAVHLLESVPV